MKKVFVFVIAAVSLLLCETRMSAQASLGIQANVRAYTAADASGDNIILSAGVPGVGISFQKDFKLIPILGFSVGIDAGYYKTDAFNEVPDQEFTAIYAEVPLRLRVMLPIGSRFALYAFAGPVASYAPSMKFTHDGVQSNWDIKPFGLMAGGGVGIDINHIRLTVSYDQGVTNLYKTGDDALFNGMLKFTGAWKFF